MKNWSQVWVSLNLREKWITACNFKTGDVKRKELLHVFNKFLFCPPENTCLEKYFPSELDSQGLLVWRTWKLRFWGESEENGGQVEPSEEAAKNLACDQKFLKVFSKERVCRFKAIFINGMF